MANSCSFSYEGNVPAATALRQGLRVRNAAALLVRMVVCVLMFAVSAAHAEATFRRGVSLSHWFEHEGVRPIDDAQMRTLRAAGFDHVRIPVNPRVLGWRPHDSTAHMEFDGLSKAIDSALNADLDVIVDIAPDDAVKEGIESGGADFDAYARLCQTFARQLAGWSESRVVLELMNEPQFYGSRGKRWEALQARLVASVRTVAPRRTLVVTSRESGSVTLLPELAPLPDAHLIYAFHFYRPYIFTHQGASWLRGNKDTSAAWITHVVYPSSNARLIRPQIGDSASMPQAALEVDRYVADAWDQAQIAAYLQPVAQWARANRVNVICNEFGVIRPEVDPESRYRYIRDVRVTLEQMRFGWTVWDYANDFGIAASQRGSKDTAPIDAQAIVALGLDGASR